MDRDALATRVTVAIVDDHPVAIEGMRQWLSRDPENRVEMIDSGASVEAVLAGPGGAADVLLLDLNLDGVMLTDRVAELCTDGRRVVVYSEHSDPGTVLAVMDSGASAFIAKRESEEHCVATILAVAADRPYVTPTLAQAIVADRRPQRPQLSDRELEALRLWFQSMSKASVARRMNITEATVRQYIDRARVKYARMGRTAPTKSALLARAIEDGLVRADEVEEYRSAAAHDA